MNRKDATLAQEADGVSAAHSGLAEKIARWTRENNRFATAIKSLTLHRWDSTTEPVSYTLPPSICLIAQGAKRVSLGKESYLYDAHSFLITSVDLPVVAQIVEASRDKPYLGLTMGIDQRAIAQLMVDSNLPSPRTQQSGRGMAVSKVSLPLLNAFQRLIDMLDEPDNIPILAPLVQREILYRILVGKQGPRMRQIAVAGSHSYQIARAIDWLKENFNQLLRIDDLASLSGMSNSTFHHQFRSITAMSPLQFQKKLRLNEARRLMLMENLDAATAAYQVGYESPSQFNREYSRLFGKPPLRDIKNLHQVSAGERD